MERGGKAFLNKKALSDIVSTLLMLLLVFVAIAIVWLVVRNVIQQGTEQISLGKFTLDLKIERVSVNENINQVNIKVRRNTGEGEFVGLKFIISNGDSTETFNYNGTMDVYQTQTFSFALLEINVSNMKSIKVAPIFKLSSGKEVVGDVKDTYEIQAIIAGIVCEDTCTSLSYTCGTQTICNAIQNCGECTQSNFVCSGGSCVLGSTCSDTCNSLSYECGTQTICGNITNCGNCSVDEICLSGTCVSSCTDTCTSLNYTCGTQNICGASTNCGTCQSGSCVSGVCTSNVTCTDTCASLGHQCGTQTVCGASTNCGTCATGQTCSAGDCISNQGCSGVSSRSCSVYSGYGEQSCSNNIWSSCQVLACAPGFSLVGGSCISPQVSTQPSLLIAHNIASSNDYTVVDSSTMPLGTVFEAASCPGTIQYRSSGVAGTNDDPLYQYYCRMRPTAVFNYGLTPGTYNVRIYLMYPFSNYPLQIYLEDELAFDVVPTQNTAVILEDEIDVLDGQLTVTLGSSQSYVYISAISVEGNGQLVNSAETCNDYIQNQDEEGIDCGGSCSSCDLSCSESEFGEVRSCLIPYGIGQQDCGEVNENVYAWSRCYPISCAEGLYSDGISCVSRTGWYSTLIDENCMADTPRMMAFGIYDIYSDRSLVNYFCGNGDSYLSYLDHSTSKVWSPPELIGDSSHQVDSHNYPQIVQTLDGNYHMFYGSHGDMIHHARTTNPYDLNSWISGPMLDYNYGGSIGLWEGIDEAINPSDWDTQYDFRIDEDRSFSYPMPVVARNGDLYLFYRNMYENGYVCGATRPHRRMAFTRSTDNGLTWEDPQEIIWRLNCTDDANNDGQNDYVNEIYLSPIRIEPVRENVPERWHMVWTLAGGESHDDWHRDLFHAYFEPSTGNFYSQDGTLLGETITEYEMDPGCIVLYSDDTGYTAPMSVDNQGRALIAGTYYYSGSNPWAQYGDNGGFALSYSYENGCHIGYTSNGRIRSCNGGLTWESYGYASLPDVTSGYGGSYSTVFTDPFHPAALIYSQFGNSFETVAGAQRFGKAIAVVGHSSSLTPQELLIKPGSNVLSGRSVPVYVFVIDEEGARVDVDGRQITLTVSGGTIVGSSTSTTTNGMATFNVNVGSSQFLKLWASSSGLDNSFFQVDI